MREVKELRNDDEGKKKRLRSERGLLKKNRIARIRDGSGEREDCASWTTATRKETLENDSKSRMGRPIRTQLREERKGTQE